MNNDSTKTVAAVYATTNYDQFELMDVNRKLDYLHISNICEDMRKNFFVTVALVEKIEGVLYIIDGQHRLKCCENENKPFYFCIINEIEMESVNVGTETLSSLQNAKKWFPADFANYFSQKGHPEYKKFCNFQETTGFPAIASYICLTGHIGVAVGPKFKNGYFKVQDEERAYVLAKIITKFMEKGMDRAATNPKFISALYKGLMRGTIDLKKLYEKVQMGNWYGWVSNSMSMTLANLMANSYMDKGIKQKDIHIENEEWPYHI